MKKFTVFVSLVAVLGFVFMGCGNSAKAPKEEETAVEENAVTETGSTVTTTNPAGIASGAAAAN